MNGASHWQPVRRVLVRSPWSVSNRGRFSTTRAACAALAQPAHSGQKMVANG